MAIILNDNVDTRAPKPTDNRFGPYTTTAAALAGIPEYQRYVGLTVGVGTPIVEWWFDSTLTLVLKTTSGTVTGITAGTGISITGTVNPTISVTTPTQLTTNLSVDVIADGASDVKYPSVKATKTYVDANVAGLLDDRGNFPATSGDYPTTGGSGPAGAIRKGDLWFISVPGDLNGIEVGIGASVRALVDDAQPNTDADWDILDTGLGFIPENVANKVIRGTSITAAPTSETLYASLSALTEYLSSIPPTTPTLEQVLAVTPTQTAAGYDINLESLDANLTTNVGRGEFSITNVLVGTSVTAVDDTITISSINDEVFITSDRIEFTNDILGTLTLTAVPNNNTLVLPNQNATLVASVNNSIFADPDTGDITIPYLGGTGTENYVPKWSSSTELTDSQIFDDGTNVGVGTATPAYKLDVNGEINTNQGIRIGTNNAKTGFYGGSNIIDFFAGNNKLSTWGLASVGGTYFDNFPTFTYNTGDVGITNIIKIRGNAVSNSSNNAGVTQLNISPTYTQQTFGTGILRGIYYNPSLGSGGINTSTHIAFENTSGDNAFNSGSGKTSFFGQDIEIAKNPSGYTGYSRIYPGPPLFIGGLTNHSDTTKPYLTLGVLGGNNMAANTVLIRNLLGDVSQSAAGTYTNTQISGRVLSASGNPEHRFLDIRPSYDDNGAPNTYTGTIRGVYYNLTEATPIPVGAKNIAFENVNGNVLLNTTSGQTAIGTVTPSVTAKLQIDSTTQGFLPPRMTQAQRLAIVSPAEGLIVYDTTNSALGVYSGGGWRKLSTEAF
jgi:hypothetical protein